jgi:hypothetical protein
MIFPDANYFAYSIHHPRGDWNVAASRARRRSFPGPKGAAIKESINKGWKRLRVVRASIFSSDPGKPEIGESTIGLTYCMPP